MSLPKAFVSLAALATAAAAAATTADLGPPPAPSPAVFGFAAQFGDWMVLQQAPAQAAVYGVLGEGGTKVSVTVTNTKDGSSYTVDATLNSTHQPVGYSDPNGNPYPIVPSWKALLHPTAAGGDFEITATCTDCTGNATATITNSTFGDMWYCSGQSNMWLPVDHSFSRNASVDAIKAGKYNNIRGIFAPSANSYNAGNMWKTAAQAVADGTVDKPAYSLFQMGATCWYFVQRLAELGVDVPIGVVDNAIGGQRIEEFMDNSTIGHCHNRSGENVPVWDGQLFAKLVLPFVDMTVKGWVWYQGENNMGAMKGSYANNLGYSCEQAALVEGWRKIWSDVDGTTDANAPFGLVTLASSGAEGADNAMGAMRIAQTAGYGVLPNDAMPNTFLAQAYDLDDPWGPASGPCFNEYQCCDKNGGPWPTPAPGPSPPDPHSPPNCSAAAAAMWLNDTDFHTGQDLGNAPGENPGSCCAQCSNSSMLKKGCQYFTWVSSTSTSPALCWFKRSNGGKRTVKGAVSGGIRPPGPPLPPPTKKCVGDLVSKCELACSAARDTPVAMGGIHPRDKKPVGDRLGTAAFNTVYGGKAAFTGPTLAWCEVSGSSLTINFDTSLLRGDKVTIQKYNNTGLSLFQVQTVATDFCMEPESHLSTDGKTRIPYCPTWAGGDGKPAPTGSHLDGGWINLDITMGSDGTSVVADLSPLNGTAPTAVRYAWNCVNCCDPNDPDLYVKYPCGPASCPIMSSSQLPANPFLAKIANGKCSCIPPQQC